MMGVRHSSVALLTLLTFASTAIAGEAPAPADNVVRARQLSDAGLDQFRRGDYRAALEVFKRSYELAPDPALLFDMAQAHRKLGQCAAALEDYRQFLAAVDQRTATQVKVAEHIEQMEACVGDGASADVGSAVATTPVQPSSVIGAMPVPLQQGSAAPQVDAPVVSSSIPAVEPAEGRRMKLLGVSLGVAGLATLVGGVGATLKMKAIQDRVSNAFEQGGPSSSNLDQMLSDGRRYQTLSDILYVSGAVALLTGTGFYCWGAYQPRRSQGIRPVVTAARSHALVYLNLSFF
jgi:tetratricopeptide (TPR) repeat protein